MVMKSRGLEPKSWAKILFKTKETLLMHRKKLGHLIKFMKQIKPQKDLRMTLLNFNLS